MIPQLFYNLQKNAKLNMANGKFGGQGLILNLDIKMLLHGHPGCLETVFLLPPQLAGKNHL